MARNSSIDSSSVASRLRMWLVYIAPSYSPATSFSRISSSVGAARPGSNSSPVDMPRAPASIASRTCRSIARSSSSDGSGPDTPAASRTALWPTNHARFCEWPIRSTCSSSSPVVDHSMRPSYANVRNRPSIIDSE